MNLWSLERFVERKAWLTGMLLPEASERSRTRRRWLVKPQRQWNATEGEAGGRWRRSAEVLLCPGPWKSDWIGRSDVVSVGIAGGRESAGVWVLLFWKEMSFRANPSLRGRGGMKCYSPDGQQHSRTSSVLQSHHPFHRVLHSHLTQRWSS